jgi:preprotein translocase subunit YajC
MEFLPLLLIVVAGALLFTSFRRGARQNRVMLQAQAGLTPGQEVQTTSGLYATVVEVGPEIVVLETGPGQQVRWNKAAIRNVVPTEAEPAPVGDEEAPPSANSPAGD